jgi:Transposase DDE domain
VDLSTFIVAVFDTCEDFFKERGPIRQRGPAPKLSDSEVVTMEIVGEFLGIDTEKGIYTYFGRHYPHYFPMIRRVHRTTFTRQAANLWVIKEHLWQHLLEHEEELGMLGGGGGGGEEGPPLMVIDSLPIPVCNKSRSYRCKSMRDLADRGRDTNLGKFLGMRAHVVIRWPGVIVRANVCAANVHDLRQAERLLAGMGDGWVLADRNYWSETVAEQLSEHDGGPTLLARFKRKGKTELERGLVWPRWLSAKRQKIETVFSQLVERYRLKVVWARDSWHFSSRFVRKILSHTMAVMFCCREGVSPTRFSELLTDH